MLDKIAHLSPLQIECLAALLLLEGVALAAIPEEIIVLSLGVLWGEGHLSFIGALIAVIAGLIPANFFMVYLGQKLGHRLLKIWPFSWAIKPRYFNVAIKHLHEHGALTILVTRFTPIIRGPVYFAVGVSRFGSFKFLKWDFISSLIQVPILLLLGRLISRSIPIDIVYRCIVVVTGVGLILTAGVLVLDFLKRNRGSLRAPNEL